MSRQLWLGDALRALADLRPDDEAAAAIVRMLGLPLHPPRALPAGRGLDAFVPPGNDESVPPPTPMADPAQAPPAGSAAAADPGRRLASRLHVLEHASPAPPPPWLTSTEPLRIDAAAAGPSRPAPPLLPRQRRRAILSAALSTRVDEGPPDMRRIVEELGRGRPLQAVPRLPRRTLRHGVELRLDRAPWLSPFHDDQLQLRDALRLLLPPGRVHVVMVDGAPLPRAANARRPRRRRAEAVPAAAPRPPTPLLLVSDLGEGWRSRSRAPAPWSEWRSHLLQLQRQGRPVVVLTPFGGHGLPRLPGIAVLPWAERTTLGDALRARAGQAPPPLPAAGDEQALALARRLSPALVVSPWLLRQARLALHLPPAAEAELCFSELVQSHGRAGLVLDLDGLPVLRADLAAGDGLDAALALCRAARPDTGGTALEEALIELELQGRLDNATAEAVLQPALAALAPGSAGAAAVAPWAAHAWSRFSPAVRATGAARQLAYAAARHASRAAWLGAAPPSLPADAAWLFDGSGHVECSIELRQYEDGSVNLVVGPAQAATTALHRVRLAATGPLWLELAEFDADGRPARRQTAAVEAGSPLQLQVGTPAGAPAAIELSTLAGDRLVLRRPDEAGQILHGALWRGVLSAPSRGEPWEWQVAALVVGERHAVIPIAGDDARLLGFDPGRTPRRLRLLQAESGRQLDATIVARLEVDGFAGFLVERADDGGTNPDPPPWLPLDPTLPPWPDGAGEATGTLWPLAAHRELAPVALRHLGRDLYQVVDGSLRDLAPALLVEPGSDRWDLVVTAEEQPAKGKGPPQLRLQTMDWIRVRAAAHDAIRTRAAPAAAGKAARAKAAKAAKAQAAPAPAAPRPAGSLRARLVALLENREDRQLGLFRIAPERGWTLVPVKELPPPDRPLLLFVHGISGDVASNFGPLLHEPGADRDRLAQRYPGAIYAWHYRSLTVGPLANTVALLDALPPRVRLHLVTYSAAGVFGELLCRGMRKGPPFDDEDAALLAAQSSVEPDHARLLKRLTDLLLTRKPRIERFVRIAAPIEGSTIYGGGAQATVTLARAIPVFGGIVGLLPGVESLLTDPAVVPGPAALVPGAGVQPLLTPRVRVAAPLTVIMGIRRQTLIDRLGGWLAGGGEGDADSDLWVSVRSAFGGLEREGGVDYLIDEGRHVDHAGYLRQAHLRTAIVDALLAETSPPPGFVHARTSDELPGRRTVRADSAAAA